MAKKRLKRQYGGKNVSIGEAFTEFIVEKGIEGVVDDTIKNYATSTKYFLRDVGLDENSPIELIDKELFLKWIAIMKTTKKITTVNHYIRDFRTFVYWCMSEEKQYITPEFKIKQVKGEEPEPKDFKKEDIVILLEKPRKGDNFGDWRNWAIVNWVLATGNREATIVDVRISDVRYNTKSIYLRHTKNKQYQTVPMSAALAHNLKEYTSLWLRNAKGDDYLFPNISGEALTTNALRHSFSKYCKKRGVLQTNLHGLRHSFANLSLDNGRSPFDLQKMLGHKTLDMTRKYVNIHNMKAEQDFDKHTPLDNLKKPTRKKRAIQRSE